MDDNNDESSVTLNARSAKTFQMLTSCVEDNSLLQAF